MLQLKQDRQVSYELLCKICKADEHPLHGYKGQFECELVELDEDLGLCKYKVSFPYVDQIRLFNHVARSGRQYRLQEYRFRSESWLM